MWIFLGLQILLVSYLTEATTPKNISKIGSRSLPFIVSIQRLKLRRYSHICVGAIIHKRFVLTAAHCFDHVPDYRVISVVGANDYLTTEAEAERVAANSTLRHKAIRILGHLKYFPLFGNDIAIIDVAPEFDFSDKRYGKLRYEDVPKIDSGYLGGWGGKHKTLELVQFNLYPKDSCIERGFKYVTRTDLCAFSPGRGACEGDSGGPLVTTDLSHIVGLLSYGKTQCKPYRIYVFTNVEYLGPWIKNHITKLLKGYYRQMGFIRVQ